MQKRKPMFEDRLERKLKARERSEFHAKKDSQKNLYKYMVESDEDDDIANLAVLAHSNFKRK